MHNIEAFLWLVEFSKDVLVTSIPNKLWANVALLNLLSLFIEIDDEMSICYEVVTVWWNSSKHDVKLEKDVDGEVLSLKWFQCRGKVVNHDSKCSQYWLQTMLQIEMLFWKKLSIPTALFEDCWLWIFCMDPNIHAWSIYALLRYKVIYWWRHQRRKIERKWQT